MRCDELLHSFKSTTSKAKIIVHWDIFWESIETAFFSGIFSSLFTVLLCVIYYLFKSRNFSWNRFHKFFKSHTSLTTIFGTIFVEGGSIILGFRIKCNESCSRSTIFGSKLAELIKRGIVGFKNGINLDKINWALCLKCGQIEQ